MSQSQLDCAVARATGENLQTIQRRGFSPLPSRLHRARRRARHRDNRTDSTTQHDVKETATAK